MNSIFRQFNEHFHLTDNRCLYTAPYRLTQTQQNKFKNCLEMNIKLRINFILVFSQLFHFQIQFSGISLRHLFYLYMNEPMNLIRRPRVHHTYHTGCLITNMFSLPFTSTRVHPRFCCRVRVAYLFNVLCYFVLVLLVFVLCPVANIACVLGLSILDQFSLKLIY